MSTKHVGDKLRENAAAFFAAQRLVLNVPGTVAKKVGPRDARVGLRGQGTLYATADFEPWQIIGPCEWMLRETVEPQQPSAHPPPLAF